MTDHNDPYELRVTGPAQRHLERLAEGTAAAIVEFMLGPLIENPHRVGGRLQRELAGLHSARRGVYRVIYEIDDEHQTVTVLRIEHRSRVYRSRQSDPISTPALEPGNPSSTAHLRAATRPRMCGHFPTVEVLFGAGGVEAEETRGRRREWWCEPTGGPILIG